MIKKIKDNMALFLYTVKLILQINKKNFTISVILSILNGVFPILTLITSRHILNEIQLLQKPFNSIIKLILLYFFIALIGTIIQNLSNYNLEKFNNTLQYGMNKKIMEKCGELSLEMFEKTETYDVITRLEQEIMVKPYEVIQSLMTFFSNLATLVSASVIIISWNVWIEVVLVLISLILCIGEILIGNKEFMMKYSRSSKEREAWYYSYLLTHDTAFKEIKSYGLKKYFINRYEELSKIFIKETNHIEKLKTILNLTISFIQDLFGLFLMILAIQNAYLGKIMIGTAMGYLNAITMIQSSTNSIAASVYSIYNSNLYIEMLREFLNSSQGVEEDSINNEIALGKIENIELKNVYYDYPEYKNVLREISIKLNKNEKIAIVGKNGSGKSTLFKVLCGLYNIKKGEFFVNGVSLSQYSISSYRDKLSVLFQDYLKFEGTVKDNIFIGDINKKVEDSDIACALESVNANFLKKEDMYDLHKTLGNWFDNGSQLSGGQWQKVALARAYYRESEVVLLDEPSSALDVVAEMEIFNNFFRLSKNKIAVYITHRVKIAKNADKIIVMENGKIIGVGNHKMLIENNPVYKEMYEKEQYSSIKKVKE